MNTTLDTPTTTSPWDGMGRTSGWPFPPAVPSRLTWLAAAAAGGGALTGGTSSHLGLAALGLVTGSVGLVLAAVDLHRRLRGHEVPGAVMLMVAGGVLLAGAGLLGAVGLELHRPVALLACVTLVPAAFLVARSAQQNGLRRLGLVVRSAGSAAVVLMALLVVEPAFVDDGREAVRQLLVAVVLGWPAAAVLLLRARR